MAVITPLCGVGSHCHIRNHQGATLFRHLTHATIAVLGGTASIFQQCQTSHTIFSCIRSSVGVGYIIFRMIRIGNLFQSVVIILIFNQLLFFTQIFCYFFKNITCNVILDGCKPHRRVTNREGTTCHIVGITSCISAGIGQTIQLTDSVKVVINRHYLVAHRIKTFCQDRLSATIGIAMRNITIRSRDGCFQQLLIGRYRVSHLCNAFASTCFILRKNLHGWSVQGIKERGFHHLRREFCNFTLFRDTASSRVISNRLATQGIISHTTGNNVFHTLVIDVRLFLHLERTTQTIHMRNRTQRVVRMLRIIMVCLCISAPVVGTGIKVFIRNGKRLTGTLLVRSDDSIGTTQIIYMILHSITIHITHRQRNTIAIIIILHFAAITKSIRHTSRIHIVFTIVGI